MKIYDQFGISRDTKHYEAVNRLIALKKKSGTDPFPVIEECFKIWKASAPGTWQSYLVRLENIKHTRADEHASVYDKEHGGYLRYTLDIPEKVMMMIRMIYTADELPMDKKFFREFAKRFKEHVVPEKNNI